VSFISYLTDHVFVTITNLFIYILIIVWGFWVSIVFGWAYEAIRTSTKPKLFVVGDRDEFTSMSQYTYRIGLLEGEVNEMKLIEGKNHFEIEAPAYDATIIEWMHEFVQRHIISLNDTCIDRK
jgi:hypothetical protein